MLNMNKHDYKKLERIFLENTAEDFLTSLYMIISEHGYEIHMEGEYKEKSNAYCDLANDIADLSVKYSPILDKGE